MRTMSQGHVEQQDDEAAYQAFLTQHMNEWDKVESVGWLAGALVIYLAAAAKGILRNYHCVVNGWFVATFPSFVLPGVVALTLPRFYKRHREAVVVAGKLLNVASWPVFRFAWQAPGAPLDVRVEFGSVWARLPVHPLAAVQCGAVSMMSLSIRHSLRFKAQLLCQLAMLVVVMQTEAAAHRTAASPQQHFLSLRNATLLQLVCGTLWPLVQHYQYDSRRRKLFHQLQRRRQQQQQQQGEQPEGQQQAEARQASGPARQRRPHE